MNHAMKVRPYLQKAKKSLKPHPLILDLPLIRPIVNKKLKGRQMVTSIPQNSLEYKESGFSQ
jgi:hypothetical protein